MREKLPIQVRDARLSLEIRDLPSISISGVVFRQARVSPPTSRRVWGWGRCLSPAFAPAGILIFSLGLLGLREPLRANPKPPPALAGQRVEANQSLCPADLPRAIGRVIQRPQWGRSRWGILLQRLDSGQALYSLEGNRYFIPASTAKLLTAAAALRQLGPEFRIRTPIYGRGTVPHLKTLRLVGRGDPTLTTENLRDVARQLKNRGVRRIEELIVENSYFAHSEINPTWEWEDLLFAYGTPANSLIFQGNAVTLKLVSQTVGQPLQLEWSDPIAGGQWQIDNRAIAAPKGTPSSIELRRKFSQPLLEITGKLAVDAPADRFELTVPNPEEYFLESFRQVLLAEGIAIDRGVINTEKTADLSEELWAVIESEKLANMLKEMNQNSNNLYAESLLKILIAEDPDSEVLKRQLEALGVAPQSYSLVDGSGLSRRNLISPEALVQVLKGMAATPEAQIYRDSLAVGGVSGTLEGRFQDSFLSGKIQGKTGTLSGVSALAGYLDVPQFYPLVFSIVVNQAEQKPANSRAAIDEIVLLFSGLQKQGCF